MAKNFQCTFLLSFFFCLPVIGWAFDDFDCIGSEPFWKLTITDKRITFNLQDEQLLIMPSAEPKSAENMKIDHIRVYHTQSNNKDVTIVIQKQSCTDGMSENGFSYEGLFIFNNKVFHGCCSKKLTLSR